MNDAALINDALVDLLRGTHDPLLQLGLSPIAATDADEYLARLCRHVSPSYLPFASDSAGIFCVHTFPGRELLDSPVVHVDEGRQDAQFVADSVKNLPAALWLWRSAYMKEPTLRAATERLTNGIRGAKPVPPELWQYYDAKPTRWSVKNRRAAEAWRSAGVGHPLAGIPVPTFSVEVEEALPQLLPFYIAARREPEVLSMFLALQAKARAPRSVADVLTVLAAESWRDLACIADGVWRVRGEGMCEWDATLKGIEDPERALAGTPFAPLIGYPETYSGSDRSGPARLVSIADIYLGAGDREGELRQARNATTLAILVAGQYPGSYAERIAAACDGIAAESLAGTLARESARVQQQGP